MTFKFAFLLFAARAVPLPQLQGCMQGCGSDQVCVTVAYRIESTSNRMPDSWFEAGTLPSQRCHYWSKFMLWVYLFPSRDHHCGLVWRRGLWLYRRYLTALIVHYRSCKYYLRGYRKPEHLCPLTFLMGLKPLLWEGRFSIFIVATPPPAKASGGSDSGGT
jgi:hypothetical protein